MTSRAARAAALLALLAAAPAAAYLLPGPAVLRRLAQRRADLGLSSLEVRGTFVLTGEAARAAAGVTGLQLLGNEISAPATLSIKMPGRCRLELSPLDAPESERPAVVVKQGRISGVRGLDRVAPAAALARGVCALLGERPGGPEPARPYVEELARLGVAIEEVALGRLGGRTAYVIGARPSERRPQASVDKPSFQPLRVISTLASGLHDVRLIDFGSPTGGDWFPRAVEVYEGAEMRARLTTEKAAANPRISDALF